jgi:hypothetical protein
MKKYLHPSLLSGCSFEVFIVVPTQKEGDGTIPTGQTAYSTGRG